MDNVFLEQKFNQIPLQKYHDLVSLASDYETILPNGTFAIIKTQPSNGQGEHWIMIANSCHKLYFADSLGRASFLK